MEEGNGPFSAKMSTAFVSSGLEKQRDRSRVADVKSLRQGAFRHLLARQADLFLVALSALVLVTYVLTHQYEPDGYLLAARACLIVSSSSLAGLIAIRLSRRGLHLLYRGFFQKANDYQLVPVKIVERSRAAGSIKELGEMLAGVIHRAMHLANVHVFVVNDCKGFLVPTDYGYRSLSCTSPLAKLIAGDAKALEINASTQTLLKRLPLEDRHWLEDGAFRLVIPILGSEGLLLGAIALGEERSDRPMSNADRQLLTTIAASAAIGMETQLSESTPSGPRLGTSESPLIDSSRLEGSRESDLAAECQDCYRIYEPGSTLCELCGGYLETAPVPYMLQAKFRLEERLGLGGMGVVYRAFDLALGRSVAIKTLPSISRESASRLRCEARTVAMVQHPHLALIYGVETWQGTPMLVFEYMEGGTLKDRLWKAPIALREVLELGMVLVDVLEHIHAVGILHRDIKPSNIGFSKEGKPKLLDFGLSHVLFDSQHPDPKCVDVNDSMGRLPEVELEGTSSSSLTKSRNIVGTPAYLCPESLKGLLPDPSFDLWSVGIVLYEALSGTNPLRGENIKETLTRVRSANIPDIRDVRSDLTEPVSQFFRFVLSRNRDQRPRNAVEMRVELELLRKRIKM